MNLTDECKIFGIFNERSIGIYEEIKIEEFEFIFSAKLLYF